MNKPVETLRFEATIGDRPNRAVDDVDYSFRWRVNENQTALTTLDLMEMIIVSLQKEEERLELAMIRHSYEPRLGG